MKDPPCWQAQDIEKFICNIPVVKEVPGCKHEVTVPCHVDIADPAYTCRAKCNASLDSCSHNCSYGCSSCNRRDENGTIKTKHGLCRSICGKKYSDCIHSCQSGCHPGNCSECMAVCEVCCSHALCPRLCHESHVPCAEESCGSSSPHEKCSMPCAAPCNWVSPPIYPPIVPLLTTAGRIGTAQLSLYEATGVRLSVCYASLRELPRHGILPELCRGRHSGPRS